MSGAGAEGKSSGTDASVANELSCSTGAVISSADVLGAEGSSGARDKVRVTPGVFARGVLALHFPLVCHE